MHLELRKNDPSLPVKPPRNPAITFLFDYGFLLIMIMASFIDLHLTLIRSGYPTRYEVLSIVLDIVYIGFAVGAVVVTFVFSKIGKFLKK
jgi:hypothetical protein